MTLAPAPGTAATVPRSVVRVEVRALNGTASLTVSAIIVSCVLLVHAALAGYHEGT